MLTRDQFKRAMGKYLEHVEKCDRIDDMFREMRLEGSPVGVAEEIEGAFLHLLADAMRDGNDIIFWWLLETNAGIHKDSRVDPIIHSDDGKEVRLNTIDDLYDFMCES